MKFENASKIYNAAFPNLVVDDDTLNKLHLVLLQIMDDVDATCRKYGISYMLGGGSCLGAVRHKGFIPWDDDVDIIMYEDEMMQLYKYIKQDYPNKYMAVLPYEGKGPERMMKIYLKGTKDIEISKQNFPSPNMIYVDIFAIVNMPSSAFARKINNKLHYLASRMMSVGCDSKYASPAIMEASKTNDTLNNYYSMRRRIGAVARITGIWFWRSLAKRLEKGTKRKTSLEGIPSGISYLKEVFPQGYFREVCEADFEGRKYYIPQNYEGYLKNLYKNYMEIPPVEKRERHIAVEIDFGKYGGEE